VGQLLNVGGLSVDRFRDVAAKNSSKDCERASSVAVCQGAEMRWIMLLAWVGLATLPVLLVGFAVVFDAATGRKHNVGPDGPILNWLPGLTAPNVWCM
jgi:hypothetical protein